MGQNSEKVDRLAINIKSRKLAPKGEGIYWNPPLSTLDAKRTRILNLFSLIVDFGPNFNVLNIVMKVPKFSLLNIEYCWTYLLQQHLIVVYFSALTRTSWASKEVVSADLAMETAFDCPFLMLDSNICTIIKRSWYRY